MIKDVQIGNQIWSARNSELKAFRNGDIIPQVQNAKDWLEAKHPAWCYYDNDQVNESKLGVLYNGYAVVDSRNIAPIGYRVPSIDDYKLLIDFLSSQDFGFKLKSKIKGDWKKMKGVSKSTDEFGFNAIAAGLRSAMWTSLPQYLNIREYTRFWTNTFLKEDVISCMQLGYGDDRIYTSGSIHSDTKLNVGCSLRFIKD